MQYFDGVRIDNGFDIEYDDNESI